LFLWNWHRHNRGRPFYWFNIIFLHPFLYYVIFNIIYSDFCQLNSTCRKRLFAK
jgi:hypothetical protein